MKVLVCGGRDFADYAFLAETLTGLQGRLGEIELVIHGAARGADSLAQKWADEVGICCMQFPANWKRDGKMAGPIRNEKMLVEGKPDMVVAFPGGRGTADCTRRAADFEIPVFKAVPGGTSCQSISTKSES